MLVVKIKLFVAFFLVAIVHVVALPAPFTGVPTESVARSQARAERIQNLMMELPIPDLYRFRKNMELADPNAAPLKYERPPENHLDGLGKPVGPRRHTIG